MTPMPHKKLFLQNPSKTLQQNQALLDGKLLPSLIAIVIILVSHCLA